MVPNLQQRALAARIGNALLFSYKFACFDSGIVLDLGKLVKLSLTSYNKKVPVTIYCSIAVIQSTCMSKSMDKTTNLTNWFSASTTGSVTERSVCVHVSSAWLYLPVAALCSGGSFAYLQFINKNQSYSLSLTVVFTCMNTTTQTATEISSHLFPQSICNVRL